MLARSYKVLGRMADAAQAYSHGGALLEGDPVLLADYAEVLSQVNGKFDGKPTELLAAALEIDPNEPQALFLSGAAPPAGRKRSCARCLCGRRRRRAALRRAAGAAVRCARQRSRLRPENRRHGHARVRQAGRGKSRGWLRAGRQQSAQYRRRYARAAARRWRARRQSGAPRREQSRRR